MINALDAAGVTAIAVRRKSTAAFSDIAAVISLGTCRVSIVAAAPGLWAQSRSWPRAIVRDAQFFAVPEYATITNPGGVDEYRIAPLVAADRMRSHVSLWHRRAPIGTPTVPFSAVLALDPERSTAALKGFRTREDLGFVTMTLDGAGRHVAAWPEKAMMPKLRVVA